MTLRELWNMWLIAHIFEDVDTYIVINDAWETVLGDEIIKTVKALSEAIVQKVELKHLTDGQPYVNVHVKT